MSIRMRQPKTQWNDQSFAMDMNWTDKGVKTAELSPNMVNRVPPTIVLVLVKDILQYFVDSPQADTMQALSTAQTTSRTVIVSVRLSTIVPHFQAYFFLAARRAPNAILQQIVAVIMQQGLLLEYKPLVNWLKVTRLLKSRKMGHPSFLQTLTQSY